MHMSPRLGYRRGRSQSTEMDVGYGIQRPDESGFRATGLLLDLSSGEEEIFCGFSEDLVFICVGEEIESVPD